MKAALLGLRFDTLVDIPGHLPTGSYELRAIGDDTLVATVTVTESAATEPPSGVATRSAGVAPAKRATSTQVLVMLGLAALLSPPVSSSPGGRSARHASGDATVEPHAMARCHGEVPFSGHARRELTGGSRDSLILRP